MTFAMRTRLRAGCVSDKPCSLNERGIGRNPMRALEDTAEVTLLDAFAAAATMRGRMM